ncbi:hypothetical protein E2562_017441 [Oryza meyeriana var. granulata]|uniref:Uncharacterized protein n=1 Tax=Oryza meyeriana var. granulata TaxID=110450 RepID=A0A6G1DYG5_9ORYZ|nr:hypothetical protein E2562_017441 [Oryza meyeriana var. granulata]
MVVTTVAAAPRDGGADPSSLPLPSQKWKDAFKSASMEVKRGKSVLQSSDTVFVHIHAARLCYQTRSCPWAYANEYQVGQSRSWHYAHCGVLRRSHGHLIRRHH